MTPEKWESIIGNIKDNFSLKDEGEERLEEEGGINIKFVEFEGPLGLMRLEFVVRPVVIDKKTTYSRRIGSETKVDYIYSEEEKSYQLKAYQWSDEKDDWMEIDSSNFD